jgi:hypothetical protein
MGCLAEREWQLRLLDIGGENAALTRPTPQDNCENIRRALGADKVNGSHRPVRIANANWMVCIDANRRVG